MPRISRTFFGNLPLVTALVDGLMSHLDKAKLDAATNANTASTVVMRDVSGNFAAGTITGNITGSSGSATGNAATATALQGGGADRTKLDGIAAGATNNPITGSGPSYLAADQPVGTGWNTGPTLSLPPGTWLLWGAAVLTATGAAGFDAALSDTPNAGTLDPKGEASISTASEVVTIPVGPLLVGGGDYYVNARANVTTGTMKRTTVISGNFATFIAAVRLA